MSDRVREKLVELQDESDICPEGITSCIGCKYHKEYAFGNPCDVRSAIADKMIAHGVTVQEWIPIAERLPESTQRVIVCRKNGNVEQGIFLGVNGWWKVYGTNTKSVTHWMPMP